MTAITPMNPYAQNNRAVIAELCSRHGEDVNNVLSVERVADGLAFEVYLVNEDGARYLGCLDRHNPPESLYDHERDHVCHPAMETHTHELIGELPEWWEHAEEAEGRWDEKPAQSEGDDDGQGS